MDIKAKITFKDTIRDIIVMDITSTKVIAYTANLTINLFKVTTQEFIKSVITHYCLNRYSLVFINLNIFNKENL